MSLIKLTFTVLLLITVTYLGLKFVSTSKPISVFRHDFFKEHLDGANLAPKLIFLDLPLSENLL